MNKVIFKLLLIMGLMFFNNLSGQNLNHHKWKQRVLIIQTSEESSESFKQQNEEFNKSAEGLKERKLVVYHVIGDSYKKINYIDKESNSGWKTIDKVKINPLDNKDDFKVTLIGLDGGVKIQKTEVLTTIELFKTIDAMPMRTRELKN